MNPFDALVEDIFNNRDITEEVVVLGRIVRAGVSALEYAPGVTDYGLDEGENFFLTVRANDAAGIKRGVVLTYRSKKYKVTRTETDSAGLTVSIYLNSLTTA